MDESCENKPNFLFGIEIDLDWKRWGLGGVIEFWDDGPAWWFQIGPVSFQHTPGSE